MPSLQGLSESDTDSSTRTITGATLYEGEIKERITGILKEIEDSKDTTTPAEYRKNIEEDPFIARGFQQVLVKEPTIPETVFILRGLKEKYKIEHKALETVKRKLWELQIEIHALEREKDDVARIRLTQAQQEASTAEKDRRFIYKKYESKEQRYNDIQNYKIKYHQLRIKQEEAERKHDLQLASDLLYYAMPDAKARIEQLEADSARVDAELCAIRGSPGAREGIFPDAVGPDQINEIVARWTGIPVTRLRISGEDKLL
ncbi:hypothetical protein OEA41_008797 [Lepraria neglecta]|uniref:Uncharacterized protein n=1 Tax=Lepraria neglecta TaxID=209136 RepID=A0AAD9Z0Q7_9LECA|nr:hypothetical protein OEA41_008797 [Lepraria neglecta]